MVDKKAFVYTDEYFNYDYGPHHPMRVERLKLTYDLIKAYGLLDLPDLIIEKTVPADLALVTSFHRLEYADALIRAGRGELPVDEAPMWGLGPGDNPIFRGMWEWSLLTTGATVQCGRLVSEGRAKIAFNMAGGLHHAMSSRASGFCYVNDIAIMIKELLAKGLRAAYVDVDAHHGDGVEAAFTDEDRVLTVSIHQHGRTLFPGTGFVYDTGCGPGRGYSVNLPLFPGADDEIFLSVFKGVVPELVEAFDPDILVTQLGVDSLRTDPLTGLCLTNNGFIEAVRIFKSLNRPWVALGGGGYHLVNVARAWTLAWAEINDVTLPNELPGSIIETIRPWGYWDEHLRDEPVRKEGPQRTESETAARQVLETIRETCLPLIVRNRGKMVGKSC